jgi:hypothetical protein
MAGTCALQSAVLTQIGRSGATSRRSSTRAGVCVTKADGTVGKGSSGVGASVVRVGATSLPASQTRT